MPRYEAGYMKAVVMKAVAAVLLLYWCPACAPPAPAPPSGRSGMTPSPVVSGSFRIVRELPPNRRGVSGSRIYSVLRFFEGAPLLFSDGEFFDLATDGPRWTWSGAPLRMGPRLVDRSLFGDRKVAVIAGEHLAAEVVVLAADTGDVVARHSLGIARELWLGEREAGARVASNHRVVVTAFDGKKRTLSDYEAPRAIDARQTLDASIPAQARRAWWTNPERIFPIHGDRLLVSALACLDQGEKLRGRILVFDRSLRLVAAITVPPWHYELIDERDGSLLLLASGNERECESHPGFQVSEVVGSEYVPFRIGRSIGEAKIVEVVYDRSR